MKYVLNNLKPIIVYWVSVLIFYIISFFDFLSLEKTCILLWITFLILNILMGFFNELKKIFVGIIIIELQFIICGVIYMSFVAIKELPYTPTLIDSIVAYGNLMLATMNKPNILNALITMLLPLSTFAGLGLRKLSKHNTTHI